MVRQIEKGHDGDRSVEHKHDQHHQCAQPVVAAVEAGGSVSEYQSQSLVEDGQQTHPMEEVRGRVDRRENQQRVAVQVAISQYVRNLAERVYDAQSEEDKLRLPQQSRALGKRTRCSPLISPAHSGHGKSSKDQCPHIDGAANEHNRHDTRDIIAIIGIVIDVVGHKRRLSVTAPVEP